MQLCELVFVSTDNVNKTVIRVVMNEIVGV